ARGPLRSCLELRGRHARRLEDAVLLSVVPRPVDGQDPSVAVQPPERRSSGHGRARRARGDLADDLVDGTVPVGPRSIEERDGAVIKWMRMGPDRTSRNAL